MIMAELREHPECESAGVEVRPTGSAWDAVLIRSVPQANDACVERLAEIVGRLREEFDLNEEALQPAGFAAAQGVCDGPPKGSLGCFHAG
jgi:hypothetical protein